MLDFTDFSLLDMMQLTPEQCREYLVEARWPDGPAPSAARASTEVPHQEPRLPSLQVPGLQGSSATVILHPNPPLEQGAQLIERRVPPGLLSTRFASKPTKLMSAHALGGHPPWMSESEEEMGLWDPRNRGPFEHAGVRDD